MSPSEIAFLALGLVLGAAVGAAIVEAIARRPTPRREVRLTITPNSIRQRPSATLADAGDREDHAPIPGSPDDSAWPERTRPAARSAGAATNASATRDATPATARTPVPSAPIGVPERAIAIPVERPVGDRRPIDALDPGGTPQPATGGSRTSALALLAALDTPADTESVRHDEGPAPATAAQAPAVLAAGAVAVMAAATTDSPAEGDSAPRPASKREPQPSAPGQAPTPAASADTPAPGADPCAGARTLVDERCQVAASARDQAKTALDVLREAQRAYDVLRERVDAAHAQADPRSIAAAKEALHQAFRAATAAATDAEATERAAREWLDQVNELNGRTRTAIRDAERGNEELRAAAPQLDRLAVDADVARIAAETAEVVCREAREALAACEESVAAAAGRAPVADEEPVAPSWPASAGPVETEPPIAADASGASSSDPRDLPVILRVLRGDRAARDRLVATVAGDNPATRGEWQIRVAQLVDAIIARAIEDGYLDLPDNAPFWSLFSARERRDIVGALSALGYRYDGLGGFADARVPAPRDLSLAVGYAGLDRMRIRSWPQEDELPQLYVSATVAADEWLAAEAGDLSLGLMVEALGARATDLADVWNAWGRLRPAMLATG